VWTRRAVLLIALGLPLMMLVGGTIVFTITESLTAGTPNARYLTGDANVRTCPSTTCKPSDMYRDGQQVIVVGEATGEYTHKSNKWYQIKYGDEPRYIHSYFLNEPLENTFELIVSTVVALVTIGSYFLIRSSRARTAAAENPIVVDRLLATLTWSVGRLDRLSLLGVVGGCRLCDVAGGRGPAGQQAQGVL
jgi:hypothetical protein